MKSIKIAVAVFLVSASLAASEAAAKYKTARLSPYVVAVSCKNGGNPVVVPSDMRGLLIVSCGQ